MRAVVFFLIYTFILPSIVAQKSHKFDRLDIENGLLNNICLALFEDNEGYIWIGGNGGLQRFDGHQFIDFTYDVHNPASGLKEMMIRHIYQTDDSTVWVGTAGGGVTLIKHGVIKEHLTPNNSQGLSISGLNVEAILQDRKTGKVWIATDNGLDIFHDGEISSFKHSPEDPNSLSENVIYALLQDRKGQLWVGTRNGLNLHLGNGRFKRYMHSPDDSNSLNAPFVHTLLEDSLGNIWIGLVQGGLDRLDPATDQIKHHVYDKNDENSLSNNIVLDLDIDQEGTLFIATFGGGLNTYKNDKFERFINDPLDRSSISNNYIEETLVDKSGNIWAATFLGGVNRLSHKLVTAYPYVSNIKEGLPSITTLNELSITKGGDIWLSMSGAHLGKFADGEIETVQLEPQRKRGSDPLRILDVLEDRQGRIWFASNGYGVFVLDNKKTVHHHVKNGLHDDRIFTLAEDSIGRIWVGSDLHGLSVHEDGQFTLVDDLVQNKTELASKNINDLYCAPNGVIWIAHDMGLSCFKNGRIDNYSFGSPRDPKFPKYNLLKITVDNNSLIWAGFDGGVCSFNPQTLEVRSYGIDNGITDRVVEGIAIDADGVVWVASHQGLSRYNSTEDRFDSFTSEYGFYDNAILALASDDQNRKMYFGGSQGLYELDIDMINKRQGKLQPVLSDFSLDGEYPESTKASVKSRMLKTKSIVLPYGQNSFSINISTLQYEEAKNIQYKIKLDGLDENYIELKNQTVHSYSRIPPGDYQIIAAARHIRDKDFVSNVIGTIAITKPWWQTREFYIGCIFLFVLILGGIINLRTKSLMLAQKELAQKVNEKTREVEAQRDELSTKNTKLQNTLEVLTETQNQLIQAEKMASLGILSSGIGHEINNPLNFIKNGALLLDKEITKTGSKNKEISKYLRFINEGVSRASSIVKSLSHMSRLGENLDEECDIHAIIENCLTLLLNSYKNKIKLIVEFNDTPLIVKGSEGKLHQVFLNILTNAEQSIEYQGEIKIVTLKKGNSVQVSIEDSGCGIEEENLKKIADPFYTTKPPGKGTGLGMSIAYTIISDHKGKIEIDSKVNEGTRFTLTLPILQDN